MTEPVDLMQAAQDAAYAAVAAAVPAGMAPVYTNVPEGAKPPLIIFGDIGAGPGETKVADAVEFEIEFVWRGKSRRGLLAAMHLVRRTLATTPLIATGASLDRPSWLGSRTERLDDGVTYAGLQRYSVEAEPA